jgi:hypothetical protein
MLASKVVRVNNTIVCHRGYVNQVIHTNTILNYEPVKTRKEIYYQNIVEEVLQGKHKVLKSGITDVTTKDTHAEIKQWRKWKDAVGQLLSYNVYDSKPNLQVYLFNSYKHEKKLVAMKVFDHYNITPFEFIDDLYCGKLLLVDIKNNKCIYKCDL